MSGRLLRFSSAIGCATLLLSLAGCAMVTDLINPSFLSTLGVDPATVIRPQGRVVIAFQNSTVATVDFGATVASSLTALESSTDYVYARDVAPNETRTMVVDCPAPVIMPIAPIGGTMATAIGQGAEVEGSTVEDTTFVVVYAGAALEEGRDYECGDVVEVRVLQTGDVEELETSIRVQVLPGR